jgi:S-formylglutathione hydrolase FrmB
VAGGSLGGVGAYRLALRFPEEFASAGLFGSGLVPGEEPQVRAWLRALPSEARPRMFLNCGEGDPLMLDAARVMMALLSEAGVPHTSIVSDGEHTYGYWVSNLAAYFVWLAEDW